MKNKQKGSALLIVLIIAILVIGVGIYFYSKQAPKSETNTQAQATSKPISEMDLLGSWATSIDGEETMNFYIGDVGAHMYGSYSHGSPFAVGTWTLDNGKLTVSFSSDIQPKTMTFTSVTRKGNILTLKSEDGKVSTHTFIDVSKNDAPLSNKTLPVSFNKDSISVSGKAVLSINDFPDGIQVSPESAFGSSDEIRGVMISPDNKWLAIAVAGAAHDFGWVYNIATKKLTPVAFSYGGGVSVDYWKNSKEVVFKVVSAKPDTTYKTVTTDALPMYAGVQ